MQSYTFTKTSSITSLTYSLKRSGRIITFSFHFDLTDVTKSTWCHCGTIPSVIKPSSTIFGSGCNAWSEQFIFHIDNNGQLLIFTSDDLGPYCYGNISWVI